MNHPDHLLQNQNHDQHSYKILCIKEIYEIKSEKKCAEKIIDTVQLGEDLYRLGNTKARSTNQYLVWIH